MIFKPNMIVILTKGRFAGRKAIVLKEIGDNMLLLAGINRIPTESADHLPNWQKRRNEKFVTFIKKLNVKHVLATRYKADLGLSGLDIEGTLEDVNTRATVNIQANRILKDAFENKKAKWLFSTLKF